MKLKPFKCAMFLSLLLTVSLIGYGQQKGAQPNSFRFVFMTDIHVEPEHHAAQGFRQAIAKVNDLHPDFVITGGDLIMDALRQNQGRADSLYHFYQVCCRDFHMPVHNTIGNHEMFGLYSASGVSPDNPLYGKEMFKKYLGKGRTYTSFDNDGWHFILLDAIGFTPDRYYFGWVDSTQLQWLSQDLQKISSATPICVCLHIPLASISAQMEKGATEPMSANEVVKNSREVLNAFNGYNLRLVLQGHLHLVEEMKFRNTEFITAGAVCGAWWEGPHQGFPEGFAVFDVNMADTTFTWRYQTYGWVADTTRN